MNNKRRKLFDSFASSLGKQKTYSLRPPYAKSEALFLKHCPTCVDTPCINSCEEQIITTKENVPIILFKQSGCTYCQECAKVCEKEVLNEGLDAKINAIFSIDLDKCLAWNEVICYTCKDVCDENAIEFFGTFRPLIEEKKCISCGFCVNPCPTNAIKIQSKEIVCDFS